MRNITSYDFLNEMKYFIHQEKAKIHFQMFPLKTVILHISQNISGCKKKLILRVFQMSLKTNFASYFGAFCLSQISQI